MPLKPYQQGLFWKWLQGNGVSPKCPSCGNEEWSLGEMIVVPIYERAGGEAKPADPMIQVICTKCSYVKLYAGGKTGFPVVG